jgi:hypothetical protein
MSFADPEGASSCRVPVPITFIVRVTSGPAGRITATVERVQTGEKCRVDGIDAIARAIAEAVGGP